MQEIIKRLELSRLRYFSTHLSIMNCILPKKMTPMEITVMATYMSLEGEVAKYRFGPTANKIVREDLQISAAGLSNYTRFLKEKGFLRKVGGMVEILPILIPEPEKQLYTIQIVNQDYEEPIPSSPMSSLPSPPSLSTPQNQQTLQTLQALQVIHQPKPQPQPQPSNNGRE